MKMERKYVMRRRVVFAVMILLLTTLFTYATADTCYVGLGAPHTHLGYGSCSRMIDDILKQEGK
jgi:hypothetical protein